MLNELRHPTLNLQPLGTGIMSVPRGDFLTYQTSQ
jgi:hypothetical protein